MYCKSLINRLCCSVRGYNEALKNIIRYCYAISDGDVSILTVFKFGSSVCVRCSVEPARSKHNVFVSRVRAAGRVAGRKTRFREGRGCLPASGKRCLRLCRRGTLVCPARASVWKSSDAKCMDPSTRWAHDPDRAIGKTGETRVLASYAMWSSRVRSFRA